MRSLHQGSSWAVQLAGLKVGINLALLILLLMTLMQFLRVPSRRHVALFTNTSSYDSLPATSSAAIGDSSSSSIGGAAVGQQQLWCPNPAASVHSTVAPFPANVWFVKTYKTGSTTLSSVINSICMNYGIDWIKWDVVKDLGWLSKKGDRPTALEKGMQAAINNITQDLDLPYVAVTSHLPYNEYAASHFGQPLLRFTSVRHPLSRVHSHFIQNLCFLAAQKLGWKKGSSAAELGSINGPAGPSACDDDTDPTYLMKALEEDKVENRWEFAKRGYQQNLMYWYSRGNATTVTAAADKYDFIFVAERMNEGLVIFMLEFGLTFEDIAYLPSKVRTGKYKTAKEMPKELNDYILSVNQNDLQLWQLANQRLDEKRQQLRNDCGVDTVGATLAAFEQLQSEITKECSDYVSWYVARGFSGPYTYSGSPGIGDESGIGFRCVRHVARRFMRTGALVQGL